MKNFPFLSLNKMLVVLRIALAVVFLSHSIVRVINSTVGQFGQFLESKGFPNGAVWVWGITVYEIIGGVLLAFGIWTKILSAGFIFILLMGIILIHFGLGWFVGEHGTGGSEYSVILITALLVVAAKAGEKGSANKVNYVN